MVYAVGMVGLAGALLWALVFWALYLKGNLTMRLD